MPVATADCAWRQRVVNDILRATLRHCWVLRSDLRLSAPYSHWTAEPTWHAVVLEYIHVEDAHRRQGHCRRLIETLAADRRFDLATVEAVQNPHLAEALLRWDWECDPEVMDFYRPTKPSTVLNVAR